MAFEGINTTSLRASLTNCKNQIDYNYSIQLLNDLNSNEWISDSKRNLRGAVEKLVNVKYNNLVSKINQYLNVTDMIEKYKSLQSDNNNMSSEINNLKPNLYEWKSYNYYYTDSEGVEQVEVKWYQDTNWYVKNRIDSLNNNIQNNIYEMETLKSKIDNAI